MYRPARGQAHPGRALAGNADGPGPAPADHAPNQRRAALGSAPRCKLCNAPFRGVGGALMRAISYGPSPLNRRLCKWCLRAVSKNPGGAEVEISVLMADVRGSTGLAERMPPEEFSKLMARFYGAAAEAVDDQDGIVDKFVGDEAVALFIPGFAGTDHAADAIASARALLESTADWIPVGVAVHTGNSFVGAIGEGDARDFTALGDTVNAASRLTSLAGACELLISDYSANAAEFNTSGLELRTL